MHAVTQSEDAETQDQAFLPGERPRGYQRKEGALVAIAAMMYVVSIKLRQKTKQNNKQTASP